MSQLDLTIFMTLYGLVSNFGFMTDIAPLGSIDHQSAGTVARVDVIQLSLQQSNLLVM